MVLHNPANPTRDDYTRAETYAATRPAVETAMTLIPQAYRCGDFLEVERERLWSRSWVCVGYVTQIPNAGDMITVTVADQSILILRDKSGLLRAFHNVCRHRGSRLVCEEQCNRKVIRCPYHSWGYGHDGRLLGAPYFDGLDVDEETKMTFDMTRAKAGGFRKEDFGLLPVRVESWGCFIFINLDMDAAPLTNWLGDLPQRLAGYPLEELQLFQRNTLHLKANWKLIAENFMEYYHLPWVHPELCNVSGFTDHYRYQGPGMYTGMVTYPVSQSPQTVDLDLPPMPGLSAEQARTAFWIMIFPNVALFLLPNHLFTLVFRPNGPGMSIEHADLLAHPQTLAHADGPRKLAVIMDFWKMVNDQDILAVERVQEGLMSRAYPGGRMCYHFEEPVHRFQNMVIDRMIGRNVVPAGDEKEEAPFTLAEAK